MVLPSILGTWIFWLSRKMCKKNFFVEPRNVDNLISDTCKTKCFASPSPCNISNESNKKILLLLLSNTMSTIIVTTTIIICCWKGQGPKPKDFIWGCIIFITLPLILMLFAMVLVMPQLIRWKRCEDLGRDQQQQLKPFLGPDQTFRWELQIILCEGKTFSKLRQY